MTLLEKFQEYVKTFEKVTETKHFEESDTTSDITIFKQGEFWFTPKEDFPFAYMDFNKDLEDDDGNFGLRCDDDFWSVAYLPEKYKSLSCKEIVNTLWPDLEEGKYEIKPDSGDPWWKEYFERNK